MGVSSKLVNMPKAMDKTVKICVKLDGSLSENFESIMGVKQGVLKMSIFQFRCFGVVRILDGCSRQLHHGRRHLCSQNRQNKLLKHLQARIQANGPLTVAEYMKEVLTNPVMGYYMHRDVFGEKGDFITSPEISQMFGELIGVWVVNEWLQCGSPPDLKVVELGPGRGTLSADMLRVFTNFPQMKGVVSLHLVEVSPKMASMQESKLTGKTSSDTSHEPDSENPGSFYKQCRTETGIPVAWYTHLADVPRGFSSFIAHEFFDALPIHRFRRTERGWCEVLVDIDENNNKDSLRFVLSRGSTLATTSYLKHLKETESRKEVEVCPEGGVLVQELSTRIQEDGGFALIADYGHSGEKTDTLRGFREHQLHDVLSEPGSADLTADVDFSYLDCIARNSNRVSTFGPITQNVFLHYMGIQLRMKVLFQKAEEKARKDLISSYDMLTNPEKMGDRFKFFAIMQTKQPNYKPAGFTPPT
ncbi:hypothetical protein ScPMuIL_013872 [Solemya velum]